MKVDKYLFKKIREWKALCEESEIEYIITNQYNEIFRSDFRVWSFSHKLFKANRGSASKYSCQIFQTKYGSFMVTYYDEDVRNRIELFPNDLKRVIYKH